MKRDLTERIDEFLDGSQTWNNLAEAVRHWADMVFLKGPLRPLKNFLSGKWLEHPLHPLLTDVPIGAWLIAITLDLAALLFRVPNLGFASALAIGVGILGALGAIFTGFLDWEDVNPRELSVGLAHGVINTTGTLLFAISLWLRWNGNWEITPLNAGLAIVGYVVLTLGAFLGGTLVFRMGTMVNRNAFVTGPDDFVSVLATSDLHDETPVRVDAEGTPVLLVRRGEEVYALGAVCAHFGAPLEEGKLKNGSIQCPWHFSEFSLADGSVRIGPATSPLPIYATRLVGAKIQVKVKQNS